MAGDGTHRRFVTVGEQPAWSPDGRQIAFKRSGEIYVADADGGHEQRLTHKETETAHTDPAWSPDGRQIVFIQKSYGCCPGPASGVYVMDADGTGLHQIVRGNVVRFEDSHPTWSPDGRSIAFSRYLYRNGFAQRLYSVRPDGSHLRRLTAGQAGDTVPAWSPEGRRIAFLRHRPGAVCTVLAVLHVRTGTVTRVFRSLSAAEPGAPAWSPDARRLVFPYEGDLYVIRSDGRHRRSLARHPPGYQFADPSWFGAAPTRTRVDARPEPVAKGASLSVAGAVTRFGMPLTGATVKIRFKAVGANRFTTVRILTTGRAGRYHTTVTARRSGTWQAFHPATEATRASRAGDQVTVRAAGSPAAATASEGKRS